MPDATWMSGFCSSYAPLALSLAKLFIYVGLVMGVMMAAAEAYKEFREAKAAGANGGVRNVVNPAVGDVIKALVGLLTGAKAWLALVILGVVLLWLAGQVTPSYCVPTPAGAATPNR
jgi:hypothetical protein